jgi:homoserine O-acetyltransferase/O-succinyltransferase
MPSALLYRKAGRALTVAFAFCLFTSSSLAEMQMQAPEPAAVSANSAAVPPAVTWPTADGVYIIDNFVFATGESLPKLRLHYLTLGKPHRDTAGHVDNAVLLLHGTGGSASSLLAPQFSTVLFGPGQPLDITRYFLILPDDIGHGSSSKPSDGLHMRFPKYDYDDMVQSQHRMLLDGLHVDHLRLILGTSMGCMQSFVWGETFPDFADALMPLACLPVQIAGRNRMMRYMAIKAIEDDPEWHGGEYTKQPIEGVRTAAELTLVMGSAPLYMQKIAPTRKAAEAYIDDYLAKRVPPLDANDTIYQYDASRNYDPGARLDRIKVPVMWLNSADDYINPPELGITEEYAPKLAHGRFVLIPISDATRGHGTHTQAAVWKDFLVELLQESEKK